MAQKLSALVGAATITPKNEMFCRRHLVALKRRGCKAEAEALELRLTAYDDDQTHVGEHEQITVNIPHKIEREKLGDKVARVRQVIKDKHMKTEQPHDPERGPAGYDEQSSLYGRIKVGLRSLLENIHDASLPWASFGPENETAAPTEGKSHSFMGHTGLNLHELDGPVSHFRNHTGANVTHDAVHKSLLSRGYKHTGTEDHNTFKVHKYKHPRYGDHVSVGESGGKVGSASHRYAQIGHRTYNKGKNVHALPAGTKVHTPWIGGEEDEEGNKPDGHHYPATYVHQNSDGTHKIKWDAEGWGEQNVSQLHPHSVNKYHKKK